MGQIRLRVLSRERLPTGVENRAYMTGMEGTAWRSRAWWQDDQLVLVRSLNESGNLHIPWLRTDGRETLLSTSTLREQAEPYLLELELARGLLNRIRNQADLWGVPLADAPAGVSAPWGVASESFVRAATTYQSDQASATQHAIAAIEAALEAQRELVSLYSSASLDARRTANRRLNTLFACQVAAEHSHTRQTHEFAAAFNAAAVTCSWKEIEANDGQFDWSRLEAQVNWCAANRLRISLGPLLRLDKQHLPDWLYLWEDDFETLVSYVTNFVEQAVVQTRGKVHVREVISRANLPGALDLSEEKQLQLIVAAVQTARRADPRIPLVVGFCQPWAEYLAHEKWEISPLHVADALMRAEIGVSGFSLEINLGYEAPGSGCRDLLDLSQMIDRWSLLGAPLLVRLAVPSEGDSSVLAGFRATPERQRDLVEEAIKLLLCKPAVHGIIYQRWNDLPTDALPHGGLVSASGSPKLALETITEIRQANLH